MDTNPFQCIVFDEFEEVITGLLLLLRTQLIIDKGNLTPYVDANRAIFNCINKLIEPLVQKLNAEDWRSLKSNCAEAGISLPNKPAYIHKCLCGTHWQSGRSGLSYYCYDCQNDLSYAWYIIVRQLNSSIGYIAQNTTYPIHVSWFDKWTYMGIQ